MQRTRAVATATSLVLAAAVVLAVGGCSVTAGRSTGSAAPPTGATSGALGPCRIEGFVPATRLVTLTSRPVVLYGTRYVLAPTSSVRFTSEMTREEPVRLRVSVRRGGPVASAERDEILSGAGAEVVDGDVASTWPIKRRLVNRAASNQSYLYYRGSEQLSGRWKARRCGAPYNDGRSTVQLGGTFRTVGRVGPLQLTACGRTERGALARDAARRACR